MKICVFPSVTFIFLSFVVVVVVVVAIVVVVVVLSKKEELNEYKITWEFGTSSNSGKASSSL